MTLEVEMGEGSGAIAELSRPFQCLQMSWNGIMGGGRKNQQVCKRKLGNQGQGIDCSLSLGRGLAQPKPSWPQTYHVDEYGLELLMAPLPPPPFLSAGIIGISSHLVSTVLGWNPGLCTPSKQSTS